jgi:TPR repeat protein
MNLQFLFERLRAAGIVVVIYSSSLFAGTDEGVLAARQGNFKLALQELTAAANQGDVEAANYAASIYLNGPPGMSINYPEAFRWYRFAAERGHRIAQNNLGHMLRMGLGVERNPGEAMKWFEQSAAQNYSGAKANIALLYCNGEGVERNIALCAKWTAEAADEGVPEAQFGMAVLSMGGVGMVKDEKEASRWAEKAAANGHREARTWVQILREKATAGQSPNTSVNTDAAR